MNSTTRSISGRRACSYRQPPSFLPRKTPSSDDSIGASSRWSIRSTSSTILTSIKKRRFSGVRKQPSSASFAAAVQDEEMDDDISIATDAVAPLLGMAPSSSKKTRQPFKLKAGSGKSLSFKIGKGKSTDGRSELSEGSPEKRKRWKPRSKVRRVPSNVKLTTSNGIFMYDSFSSSRETPTPPPDLLEPLELVDVGHGNFFEHTLDYHDGSFGDLSGPNHFRSLECSEKEEELDMVPCMGSSARQSCFITSFEPIPTVDELDDFAEDQEIDFEALDNESDDEKPTFFGEGSKTTQSNDQDHVLSASAGIKFFESLSPHNSCGSFKSPNRFGSLNSPVSITNLVNAKDPEDQWETSSQSSIPSLSNPSAAHQHLVVQPEASSDKEMSDSVLAWSLLGAVMGLPAPQSVLPAKKRRRDNRRANLWLDDHQGSMDACDLIDISGGGEDAALEEPPTDVTKSQRAVVVASAKDKPCETSSIPEVGGLYLDTQNDVESVPDISEDLVTSEAAISQKSNEDIANSTIAWSALAALLGSPAPSCVLPSKERKVAKNLWVNDAMNEDDEIMSLACSEIDPSTEDDFLPSLPISDDDSIAVLSLSGLQLDSDDSCVPSKDDDDINEEDDDLISPTHVQLPCMDESDDLSFSALDLGFEDFIEATSQPKKEEDITNSTIAWGALTALLGMPAPGFVHQKDNRQVKNLWADDVADADDDLVSLAHSQSSCPDDLLSASQDDDTIGGISLSALQLDSDELNQHKEERPLQLRSGEDAVSSTIAWGALTVFLGLPASSCVLQKGTRPAKNLWPGVPADGDNIVSLEPLHSSCDDDCDSVPSLVAESQSESYPSSPEINAIETFESISTCSQDNVVDTFVQWGH